jgi:rhodanese-related sulfurtransferase
MARGIERAELRELMATGVQLVEVLPAEEYRDDHLPGAISLPLTRLDAESAATLDAHRTVAVYCWDRA